MIRSVSTTPKPWTTQGTSSSWKSFANENRAGVYKLELFHNNIRAFLTHETLTAPSPSYLECGDLAACPAPDLQPPRVEIWILLQGREADEDAFIISRRA